MKSNLLAGRILAYVLSAALAFPAPVWAAGSEPAPVSAGQVMDNPPAVVVERVLDQDGNSAYLVVTTTNRETEAQTVRALADATDDQVVLLATDQNDPAYRAAANTGRLGKVKAYFAKSLDKLKFFTDTSVPQRLKSKITDKLNRITQTAKDNAFGVVGALIYGSVMGASSTFIFSGSLPGGLIVLGTVALVYTMLATHPDQYRAAVNFGGAGARKIVESVFGELGEAAATAADGAGKFLVTWGIQAAVYSFMLYFGNALDSLPQALFLSFISNTGVWDVRMLNMAEAGKISERALRMYFPLSFLASALSEFLGMMGVGGVQAALMFVTVLGFLDLAFGQNRIDRGYARARDGVRRINTAMRMSVATISRVPSPKELARRCAQKMAKLGTDWDPIPHRNYARYRAEQEDTW